MLLLWIYTLYRGHLELKKRKVANTIKSTHWSGKHTVISLQKSYNGRKHNNKVALLLEELAAYVELKQPHLHVFFFFFDKLHLNAQDVSFCLISILQNSYEGKQIL